jgi:hypothetical protein
VSRAETYRRIEKELRQAKAEALGRAGERLEAALAHLAELDARLDRLLAGTGRDVGRDPRLAREAEARNRVRDEAMRLRLALVIQREALGLLRHAAVDEHYRVPPRRFV